MNRETWASVTVPDNVLVGEGSVVAGSGSFRRFSSTHDPAITIGRHCTLSGVQFALGGDGILEIGDYCYFTDAVLLCERNVRIGNYVELGWNATISDTDFHPVRVRDRIEDALALSPAGDGRQRPAIPCRPVTIEDGAWIGPNATILKGVTVGRDAIVEPGSLVTSDVAPGTRVLGNPARELPL